MEPQVLGVQRSYHSATHQQPWSRIPPDGTRGFCAVSSSSSSVQFASLRKQQLHPQWHFRVEKKVTLRPARRSNALEVRASKKSGTGFKLPGTLKLKRGEESSGEDKEVAAAENGTQKLRKPSGTVKLPGTLRLPGRAKGRRKVNNVVFVAGSTGKVGRRVVRELLQLGYSVRAGVRNSGSDKAKTLLEFAAGTDKPEEKNEEEEEAKEEERPSLWSNFAPEKIFGFLRSRSAKKEPGVDLVEVDLEKPDELDGALGEAGVVVCAIGASEKEAFNVTAPYRIDYKATENLINAAIDAKVNHFVLVTSLGTQKIGWPASVLNLFWGVLVWKAKAEKALIESGIPFTIIRPGGMEKPTDTYKDTHNLLLAKADSRFGGQVSSLQVAELIAGVVSNLELAQDKVLEAVAETTAPLRYIEDLLAEIPSASEIEEEKEAGISKLAALKAAETEEKLAKQEELKAAKQREEEEKLAKREELIAAKQREEEERLAAEARAAAEKEKTEALRQKLQNEYLEAKQREEEASKDAEAARLEKEEIERRVADIRSRAEAAAQAAREAKALEVATRGAARQGTKLTDQEKKDIVASVRAEIEAEAKQKEAKEKAIQDSKVKTKPVPDVKSKVAEKGKKDAEAKAVAEEERVAKAEAAKKAKAEAEEKEKAEAEIRAKAKAEEKAKAEAESKAKAEAEAVERAKAEAEIKEKAEAEKQLKVEAERKAKQEEEEKLKAEAEAKAEEAKEKAIEKSPVSELPAPPIPSPPKVADEVADPAAEAVKVALGKLDKVLAEEAPEALEEQQDEAVDEKEEERQRTLAVQAREESKAREQLALEKAKSSSVNFLFPWQKAQPAAERPEKETSSSKPDLVAPLNEAVDNTIGSLSVPETEELQDSRKPPSSPSPSAPGPPVLSETQAVAEKDDAPLSDTEAVAEKDDAPLSETETVAEKEDAPPAEKEPSPTNGFVDLKPLSSATPSPLSNIDKTGLYYAVEEATDIAELATQQAAEAAARAEEALEKAKAATAGTFAWPWQNTDPAAPNNGPTPLDSATPVQQLSSTDLPRTPRPLSPYARYPGLKPPTSPTPSAPKSIVKEEASDPPSGQELASAAEDEKVQEVVTQVLETASTGSFRWPWQ